MKGPYLQVAVNAPIKEPLTYLPPKPTEGDKEETLQKLSQRGQSVIVPLGKRKVEAVILGLTKTVGAFKLKNISEFNQNKPCLPHAFLQWLEWVADYYLFPLGQVTHLAFPPLKQQKSPRKSKKSPIIPNIELSPKPKLTEEQQSVIENIQQHSGFARHLLFGVTGSGKTEVYLQLIEEVLTTDQQVLVLVPEISLTPQLVQRFAARFKDKVAVIHSHLTPREKTNQWWSVVNKEKSILIGVRSALFCPIENIGLIVIDEEHEPSFKQEEKLKYHARDAAIKLAQVHNCPIVLGSATPSMESWNHAQSGKYKLHQMKSRVSERQLPLVEVIDLRSERKKENPSSLPFWLTTKLYEEIETILEKKQQAALFLNRRGVAQTVLCQDCGHIFECPNCDISLTLHGKNHLVCHYCDYDQKLPEQCPQCESIEVSPLGFGTETIEKNMAQLFPEARLARADRDEINTREDLENLIDQMEAGDIDILIGTQMIAKGLDFPKLNLVGLVMADVGFNMPDFRASERSFQLLTQMAGRSGRHSKDPGKVIVQTYNPEHLSVQMTETHNFVGFAQRELAHRKELNYPPFGRLAAFRIYGNHIERVQTTAHNLAQRAERLKKKFVAYNQIQILGPTPAPLTKVRGKYRYHLLVKTPQQQYLKPFCRQLLAHLNWCETATKVQVDIDPISLM